mmetsp:Transcript_69508/g.110177  ORF Transcript_69508/g.110177 Transcript_69508/m.110177 type:complete len:185 (+) Transcript_69508:68-622(+)
MSSCFDEQKAVVLNLDMRNSVVPLSAFGISFDSAQHDRLLSDVVEVPEKQIAPPGSIQSARSTELTDSEKCDDCEDDGAITSDTDSEVEDDAEEILADDIPAVMLKGIPLSFYLGDFMRISRELGFDEEPDLFYVPMAGGQNYGYALISFSDLQITEDFSRAISGHKVCRSCELMSVAPASLFA